MECENTVSVSLGAAPTDDNIESKLSGIESSVDGILGKAWMIHAWLFGEQPCASIEKVSPAGVNGRLRAIETNLSEVHQILGEILLSANRCVPPSSKDEEGSAAYAR